MAFSRSRKQLLQWLLFSCLLLPAITSPAEQIQIGREIRYLEDPNHILDLDSARTASGWKQNNTDVFNPGYSSSTWWVNFNFQSRDPDNYILQIAYAVLDHLDIYVIHANGDIGEYRMGDKLPFASRPLKHRLFSVPFSALDNRPVEIFVKVRPTSSIQLPVTISKARDFRESNTSGNVIHGVYLGGMLCIAIYNLLIFIMLRDKIYLFYVAYVTANCTFLACLNGWGFQFLWPTAIWWNDQAILICLNSVVFWGHVYQAFSLFE